MKNFKQLILAIIVLAFTVIACKNGSTGGGGNSEHWLISSQKTYTVTGGIAGSETSTVRYNWISYHYSDDKNYEEEYSTDANSITYNHYTRNGQTADSENISLAGTTMSTYFYDAESGLTKNSASTNSSGVSTATSYVIEKLSDSGGIKTYKYYPLGSAAYSIYKIQNGRTQEVRYYNADGELVYTTTYTLTENNVIRNKLGNFTLYSTSYSSSSYSINSSFQTAEVLSDYATQLVIRVKTFNDGVLASQTDTSYVKKNPNKNDSDDTFDNAFKDYPVTSSGLVYGYFINNGEEGKWRGLPRKTKEETERVTWDEDGNEYTYKEIPSSIMILGYKGAGGNVAIPAQIDGLPVTEISVDYPVGYEVGWDLEKGTYTYTYRRTNCGFTNCINLTSVIIPDSVIYINSEAFKNCLKLTSINIPNSVKVILGSCADTIDWAGTTRRIEREGAFKNCISLTSVIIPDSVEEISAGAFSNCGLTSITFQSDSVILYSYTYTDNADKLSFPGDLVSKYYAGGKGTYTRPNALSETWTKQ